MRQNRRDVIYTSKRKAISFLDAAHIIKSESPDVNETFVPWTPRQKKFREHLKGTNKKKRT
jgi:hypothetical protein